MSTGWPSRKRMLVWSSVVVLAASGLCGIGYVCRWPVNQQPIVRSTTAKPPPPTRYRVSGDSMFPTLAGECLRLHCQHCATSLRVSLLGTKTSCHHCGQRVSRGVRLDSEVVQVERLTPNDELHRWDVVTIADPEHSGRTVVKRVIGLPGERVAIRAGRVFANDRLCVAPSAWRAAILVSDLRSPAALAAADARSPLAEWRNYYRIADQLDDVPYNTAIRRRLEPAFDFRIEGELTLAESARPGPADYMSPVSLLLRWRPAEKGTPEMHERTAHLAAGNAEPHSPGDRWVWQIAHRTEMQNATANRATAPLRPKTFSWERYGNQCWFVVDGRLLASRDDLPLGPGELLIAESDRSARLARVRVVRSLTVCRHSPGRDLQLQWQLNDAQVVVVGDNSPVSRDCRHWGALSRSQIRGRVVRQ